MKESILNVDGHNLLFQMFYGMPNKIYNQDGIPIHGVIGFIGALLKIIKINCPDYAIVLFDKEQKLLRQDINKNYKKNRIDYSDVPLDENIKLIKYTQKYDLPYELDELKVNISDDIKTMVLLKKANIIKT